MSVQDEGKKGVKLPELPTGKDFEEYVLAYLQTQGLFTEKNLEQKGVMEIDIVATKSAEKPESRLIEAKSGKWGMTDVFKIKGWMDYLKLERGMLITLHNRGKENSFGINKSIAQKLGVELLTADIGSNPPFESDFISHKPFANLDLASWRYSYWIERKLLERLVHKLKTHPDKKRFKAMMDYHYEINRDIFFSERKASRVLNLYSTFQKYPKISAQSGNEIEGNDFDADIEMISENMFRKTFYDCEDNDIQISSLLEYKTRLAILKNTIDYQASNPDSKKKPFLFDEDFLPTSFKEGAENLKSNPHFYKYPIFWQWFLWVFGGFVLQDRLEEEHELFASKTGIPVEEIPNALRALDVLFPTADGWFLDLRPNCNVRVLKMFPIPFRGMGVHYRMRHYSKKSQLSDLGLTGRYTHNDLAKWNNVALSVLSGK